MNDGRMAWLMTIVMAAGIAFSLFTGRIRYRGWPPIDRDARPALFRLPLTGWSVVAPALLATAIVHRAP